MRLLLYVQKTTHTPIHPSKVKFVIFLPQVLPKGIAKIMIVSKQFVFHFSNM